MICELLAVYNSNEKRKKVTICDHRHQPPPMKNGRECFCLFSFSCWELGRIWCTNSDGWWGALKKENCSYIGLHSMSLFPLSKIVITSKVDLRDFIIIKNYDKNWLT